MTFSIIVPVYNVAPYLRECLDSVLAQTCADWECICVDDGSTDGSGSILDEFAKRDARFAVIHDSNHGVSSARNIALDKACGDWVFFLDADDLLHPEALTRLAFVFQCNSDIDVIAMQGTFFQDGTQVVWPDCALSRDKVSVFGRVCPEVVDSLSFMGGRFSVRRKICHGVFFPPYRFGEDRLFMLSCSCLARCIAMSDFVTGAYRQRNSSASHEKWDLRRMKEEFRYRIDCMRRTQLTGINFRWGDVRWMEEFLFGIYIRLTIRSFRGKERCELIGLWNTNAKTLFQDQSFCLYWRLACRICDAIHSAFLFALLLYAFPRVWKRMTFWRTRKNR